jgi:hypothetical protein
MNQPITDEQRRIGKIALEFLGEENVSEEEREAVFAGFCCGYDRGEKAQKERVKPLVEALEEISHSLYEANPWTIVPSKEAKIAQKALQEYRGEE